MVKVVKSARARLHRHSASLILEGDAEAALSALPDGHFQCCVTSPPYWGLRDYRSKGQIGAEDDPDLYVNRLVSVFEQVRRVLRDDGTLWLNVGDSYTSGDRGYRAPDRKNPIRAMSHRPPTPSGLKPKDLVGVPWRLAFALQKAGWFLRSDIIWCLSGGTWLYVRSQKGDMPMMARDLARLNPSTVRLWNGEKWTQLLGMKRSTRRGDELEMVLRSGERISCTPLHRFPTSRGLCQAREIRVGDILRSTMLPGPEHPRDCAVDEDAAWLAGLYIAEGSRCGDAIQISGHAKEVERWAKLREVAAKFGGYAHKTDTGNTQAVRLYGKLLNAILDELVSGRTAHDKCFAPVAWRYSNQFIAAMLDGYLDGDGHEERGRWRLGFCRNYNLERDIRTACARLGYSLTLNLAGVKYRGRVVPTFRGELRKKRSGHPNEKNRSEVVAIRKARCREVYDLGVADEPHVFSLASGVLTHNSKPNAMPESVKDRPTRSHEYVFLMSRSEKYLYNEKTVREANGRNRRTLWSIPTEAFPGAHFATFPTALVEPCVLAGSSPGDWVLDPFFGSGTVGVVCEQLRRRYVGIELNPEYVAIAEDRIGQTMARPGEVDGKKSNVSSRRSKVVSPRPAHA